MKNEKSVSFQGLVLLTLLEKKGIFFLSMCATLVAVYVLHHPSAWTKLSIATVGHKRPLGEEVSTVQWGKGQNKLQWIEFWCELWLFIMALKITFHAICCCLLFVLSAAYEEVSSSSNTLMVWCYILAEIFDATSSLLVLWPYVILS